MLSATINIVSRTDSFLLTKIRCWSKVVIVFLAKIMPESAEESHGERSKLQGDKGKLERR